MKKIILLLIVVLLIGCSKVVNNKKPTPNTFKNTENYKDHLTNSSVYKIINNQLIIIEENQKNKTVHLTTYNLDTKKQILNKKIFDQPYSRDPQILEINDGFAIVIGNNMQIYYQNKQISNINLDDYFTYISINSIAISPDHKLICCIDRKSASLLTLNTETLKTKTALNFSNKLKKLNTITDLEFADNNTLIYTGLTFTDMEEESVTCYGSINLNKSNYTLNLSPELKISKSHNKILLNTQQNINLTEEDNLALIYENNKFTKLKYKLNDTFNLYLKNGEIMLIEYGIIDEVIPYIVYKNKKHQLSKEKNISINEIDIYKNKAYIVISSKDNENKFIERTLD